MRLPWLTMTPFGVPVDPDVYCRNASASRPVEGGLHSVANSIGSVSVPTH